MPNPLKIPAIVEEVKSHGGGVYTVIMKPEGRVPKYKAGQFLHWTVDDYDPLGGFWPESRVFSIASRSGVGFITIVYSVKGLYTGKMEKTLIPGAHVWLKLPYGDFVIESNIKEYQDVVLIAGGTGISPFIPYLESLCTIGNANRAVTLYYGVRLKSCFLFPELVECCSQKVDGFHATVCIESESSSGLLLDGIRFQDGRLSIDAIWEETNKISDPVYFVSGPPIMITLFKQQLFSKGVKLENIKIDEWE